MPLTFGSLFAGIGGADLGFERAGMICKWQVEIDPFCLRVLAKNFPKVTRFADVTTLTGVELEQVDVIVGGFPCQDVSNAGAKRGIEGARSSLFRHAIRLARLLKPNYLVFENVRGLLARGMGTVLQELSQIGYVAEWEIVPACSVGAPHLRERVFIVAYPATARLSFSAVFASCPEKSAAWRPVDEHAPLDLAYWQQVLPARSFRVSNGLPTRLDRVRAGQLGNAIVPQVAEYVGRDIIAHARRVNRNV